VARDPCALRENGAVLELSPPEISSLLDEQLVGRIGCHSDGVTYVVPVIYAYDGGSVYVLSTEGQKVTMMRANPEVCFEVDRYDGPGSWRSVVAQGRYEELDEEGLERARALLVERVGRRPGTGNGPSRPRSDRAVVGFRIRLESATGRAVVPA
jgi:nitroimidazol reductase NimA-like FMN-containing flavoprotein (pyridoxamine 5'-phosphate oxidase superfamily)